MIINARSEDEISEYMKQSDMYYEVIDNVECQDIKDIELAGLILFEGDAYHRGNEKYNTIIECLRLIN
jgi:hypothetical protein